MQPNELSDHTPLQLTFTCKELNNNKKEKFNIKHNDTKIKWDENKAETFLNLIKTRHTSI